MVNSAALVVPSTDHHLLRQVAAGDEQAFDELYRAYNVIVYNYILRLMHEPNVAEDLLQEVFLAAWQGAARFRQESKVKTWLLRIAHYQTVSWLRRIKAVSSLDDMLDLRDESEPIEEQIVQAWQAEQIRVALDQLSAKHRAVIELAFVHDLPYIEIADVLACPIGTVKSRISYALRSLTGGLKRMETRNETRVNDV
ncbi:MAG TPA: RNA polymerase sigma factor [Anaerolineae bacterium]|nr:RNA polymerase sigma factor [Anaerolineae bacterium]